METQHAPFDPKFHEYLEIIAQFIQNPTAENLSRWAKAREDGRVGNRGYCHPFGCYNTSVDGVDCFTGSDTRTGKRAEISGQCPAACDLKKMCGACRLRKYWGEKASKDEIAEMLTVAIQLMAAYQSRFPDLTVSY